MKSIEDIKNIRQRKAGFTLIEIMLSMTILGLAMGILGRGYHMVAKGWARAGEKAERQEMHIRGLAMIRRYFDGLERQNKAESKRPALLFNGSQERARFVGI